MWERYPKVRQKAKESEKNNNVRMTEKQGKYKENEEWELP